jgi:stage II sporulation protein AA (anti-sigma F factor antagonist)
LGICLEKADDRILIIKLDGDVDHHAVEKYKDKIDNEYERNNCKHIVFDFAQVGFLDSSGIGMIIGRYKNAMQKNGRTAVAGMGDCVSRIYSMSGLAKIIEQYDSLSEAVDYIK